MPVPKKSTAKTPARSTSSTKTMSNSSTAVAELPQKPKAQQSKASQVSAPAGTTQVVAQIDVGFGNKLTIRGQGAGLRWNAGQPMLFQNNAWTWSSNSKENFEFKVLLNDEVWQQGNNILAKAGSKVVFRPQF